MTYPHKAPLLPLLVTWIAGILVADIWDIFTFEIATTSIILTTLCYLVRSLKNLVVPLTFITLFISGGTAYSEKRPPEIPQGKYILQVECLSQFSETGYKVQTADGTAFYLHTDTTCIHPGNLLSVSGFVTPVRDRKTDIYTFNHYLLRQNIGYRISADTLPQKLGNHISFYLLMQQLREHLSAKCDSVIPDPVNRSIVKACVLGDKTELTDTTYRMFTLTGTAHLMAVSGLHVGAVYLLIVWLLKLLHTQKLLRTSVALLLIWCYACVTGLSPSVLRAASILTFIGIGNLYNRRASSLNALAASALVTLLFDPFALWSVSMQMSYAAYGGILLLYPLLHRYPRHIPRYAKFVHNLLCVTLAAQIATLPLCILYFHTVNYSGILINLIAVPLTTILLYAALFTLLLPGILASVGGLITNGICTSLCSILQTGSTLDGSLYDVYPHTFQIALIYILLMSAIAYLSTRRRSTICLIVASFIILCGKTILTRISARSNCEIVIFDIPRGSCITQNRQGSLSVLHRHNTRYSQEISAYLSDKDLIDNDTLTVRMIKIENKEIPLHIISQKYLPQNPAGILIITDNVHPRQIQLRQNIHHIIIDGSVSSYRQKIWQEFCINSYITYSSTRENGRIVLPID